MNANESMTQFIDSHCHIDGPEYDADRDEVIARAREAGVTTMLNVGTGDPHSGAFERAVELAEKHNEDLRGRRRPSSRREAV